VNGTHDRARLPAGHPRSPQRFINIGSMRPQLRAGCCCNWPLKGAYGGIRVRPFLLDPARRSLLREGVPQSLPPKAFDVLALLVQCHERVVSKEELLSTLWADTFVEEGNLSQQVFVLRRTLNGLSESPEYIATIPRRGYRFTAQVIERPESERLAESAPNEPSRRRSRWLVPSLAAAVVLVAAMLAVFWRHFATDPDPRILVVTAFPGLERFPSISPDGNFVVFSWTGSNPDGSPDLWIKAVEGDALRPLTETPAAEFQSAWSPDGREIAFVRAGQGVFIVSALGGQERRISGSGSMGWTPDSRSLLVRDRTDEGPHGIFRIELATGTRHQVTRAPKGMGDWAFAVSPDGSTLAFVRYERPGISDVYVAPIAGGEPRRRTNWNATISAASWASNGREILYSVAEAPGLDHSLFRIPADGDRIERGTRALHTNVASLSMSRPRSGQPGRMAFTRGRIDVGLRLVDLEGQRVGDVFQSIGTFSDSTRVDFPGRFSRDGKQVAFLSDRTGWAEVWIANADGSGLRQATTLHATELDIGGWSPDSRRLVIDAAIAGNSDVFLVSPDGGSPVRVTTEPGSDGLAEWSSDGRWIYFTSDRSGRPEVWKVPVEGGEQSRITREGGFQPRQGPDGRTLFYLDRLPAGVFGVSGTSRLMQVPVAGGKEAVVLDRVRFGLWSVTQDGIVFLTVGAEADAIDFYRFGDREVRRLGTLPFRASRIAGLGGLTASWDGRWVLVSTTDVWESDIMVVDGVR
jgi:Tol biopolymer transport system component/DNA-binding winged helix-turn-helix (wHTH) protein